MTSTAPSEGSAQSLGVTVRTVHLYVYVLSNDDGSYPTGVTAQGVANRIPRLNAVFANTGVRFAFDTADSLSVNWTLANQLGHVTSEGETVVEPYDDARATLADLQRGKLVIFLMNPVAIPLGDGATTLPQPANVGAASSPRAPGVSVYDGVNAEMLAHEIGHYLHLGHTFGKVESIAAASSLVQAHPGPNKLDALDDDRPNVLDTPADLGTSFYSVACPNPPDITIPGWPDPVVPDVHNVMSYYVCGGVTPHFSPQQGVRMVDALDILNRHHLISAPPPAGATIQRGGSASAWVVDEQRIIRIGTNRVATVTRSGGMMRVAAWDVATDGSSIRLAGESVDVGPVSDLAAEAMGLGVVLTAVRDGAGRLRLITWQVHGNGFIERRSTVVDMPIQSVTLTRWDVLNAVTSVRDASGNLRLIDWRIHADGTIERVAEDLHAAGAVDAVDTVPRFYGVDTVVRDASGNLKVLAWEVYPNEHRITRLGWGGGGAIEPELTASALVNEHLMATATLGAGNRMQKVVAWINTRKGAVLRRGELTTTIPCVDIDSVRLGANTFVTGCQVSGSNDFALTVFEVSDDGFAVDSRAFDFAGPTTGVSLARSGRDVVVSALRTPTGRLKLIAWRY